MLQYTEPTHALKPIINRLRRLDDGRMADVIEARFGLLDGRAHTLEEIGDRLGGLTRERIRQIEQAAIKYMWQLATDSHEQELLANLQQLRQSAKAANRQRNRTPRIELTSTQLSDMRREIEYGNEHLLSLGISV